MEYNATINHLSIAGVEVIRDGEMIPWGTDRHLVTKPASVTITLPAHPDTEFIPWLIWLREWAVRGRWHNPRECVLCKEKDHPGAP